MGELEHTNKLFFTKNSPWFSCILTVKNPPSAQYLASLPSAGR